MTVFKLQDLFGGNKEEDIPKEHLENLKLLLPKLNRIAAAYGKTLTIGGGYRTLKHHLEIYAKKGITDISKIPMKSKHLFGLAVDLHAENIVDFQNWMKNNSQLAEELNIFFEDTKYTKSWLHVQIEKFASYKPNGPRYFIP